MYHGKISLSPVLLLLLVNFVNRFGWNCKYQVKSLSSPWSPAACAAALVLYQQNKFSDSKVKFR